MKHLSQKDFQRKAESDAVYEAYEAGECEECGMTGYRGRKGIFELLPVDEGLRQLVLRRSSSDVLKDYAITNGMRTLRDDGWRKVREGTTTVSEVVRVTQQEENVPVDSPVTMAVPNE